MNDVSQSEHWDITKSADKLGSLAGILAAFAFGALVIMVTAPPKTQNVATASALHLMLGSFFSLIVASFLFSVLAGYGSAVQKYRPFVEGLLASWILALSTVELCLCTVWLLKSYNVQPDALTTGRAIVYGAIVISSLSLTGVAVAPLFQRSGSSRRLMATWIVISLLPVLAIPIGWWVLPQNQSASVQLTVGASVSSTVVMALAFALVDTRTDGEVKRWYGSKYGYLPLLPPVILLGGLYSLYVRLLPT
jgi:hypothetical protein